MTVIRPNSISGINSITGNGGDISIFRADGTAADVTVNNITSGIITATTFKGAVEGNVTGAVTGSGANLTSIPAAQLTGTVADARLSTVSSSKLSGALPAIDGSALTGVGVGTADSINTSGIITATAFVSDTPLFGRNKIINGEFRVNQRRHTGSAGHNSYTLDRWKYGRSANTEFSTSQSTDTPDGFANSVHMDCIGANGSTGAGDYAYWRYHIEGQDLQDLSKGTSAAKPFTLSFYFKSDITGVFAIHIADENSRMCNANYTVSNTNWNRYIITIPADTTGTIANSNAAGLEVRFYIIAGSNHTSGSAVHTWGAYSASSIATGHTANIVSTSHNLYLTGVQLEVGSVATPFEHRSFGEELIRCKRYFNMVADGSEARSGSSRSEGVIGNGFFWQSNRMMVPVKFQVAMRTPNWTLYKKNGEYRYYANGQSNQTCTQNDIGLNGQEGLNSAHLNITNISSSSAAGMFFVHDVNAALGFDAEL